MTVHVKLQLTPLEIIHSLCDSIHKQKAEKLTKAKESHLTDFIYIKPMQTLEPNNKRNEIPVYSLVCTPTLNFCILYLSFLIVLRHSPLYSVYFEFSNI